MGPFCNLLSSHPPLMLWTAFLGPRNPGALDRLWAVVSGFGVQAPRFLGGPNQSTGAPAQRRSKARGALTKGGPNRKGSGLNAIHIPRFRPTSGPKHKCPCQKAVQTSPGAAVQKRSKVPGTRSKCTGATVQRAFKTQGAPGLKAAGPKPKSAGPKAAQVQNPEGLGQTRSQTQGPPPACPQHCPPACAIPLGSSALAWSLNSGPPSSPISESHNISGGACASGTQIAADETQNAGSQKRVCGEQRNPRGRGPSKRGPAVNR